MYRDRRGWFVVLLVALSAALVKLAIAWTTFGTDDVRYWMQFAEGVRQYGPIGIYGHHFEAVYNHPPVAGWILVVVNRLVGEGIPFPFAIRLPAILADVATACVAFELLRLRMDVRYAVSCVVLIAWSPVTIIVSGFHGNTDPFLMLLVLAAVLAVLRFEAYRLAGALLGLAISVKLVPLVVIPAMAVMCWRRGRRALAQMLMGVLLVFLVLWLPVLLERRSYFVQGVLGYVGVGRSQWGLWEFALALGVPQGWYGDLLSPLSYLAVLLAALLPAWLLWRRPHEPLAAIALAVVIFLVLSPAFGMQYLVWPLAVGYLITPRIATAYNVLASAFALLVYSSWNSAPPWAWYEARSTLFTPIEVVLGLMTWLALVAVAAEGLIRASSATPREQAEVVDSEDARIGHSDKP